MKSTFTKLLEQPWVYRLWMAPFAEEKLARSRHQPAFAESEGCSSRLWTGNDDASL